MQDVGSRGGAEHWRALKTEAKPSIPPRNCDVELNSALLRATFVRSIAVAPPWTLVRCSRQEDHQLGHANARVGCLVRMDSEAVKCEYCTCGQRCTLNMAKRALIAATADFEEQCAFFEVGGGNCACANMARMESLYSDAWMQQFRQ